MDVLVGLMDLLHQLLLFTAHDFFFPAFSIGFFLICLALVRRLLKGA